MNQSKDAISLVPSGREVHENTNRRNNESSESDLSNCSNGNIDELSIRVFLPRVSTTESNELERNISEDSVISFMLILLLRLNIVFMQETMLKFRWETEEAAKQHQA